MLQDLPVLFQRVMDEGGFPPHLCKSTVSCVPKTADPEDMSQCRPITVFATIYRYFSSTITKLILKSWKGWLPSGIQGAMPGCAARDTALRWRSPLKRPFASVRGFWAHLKLILW